MRHFESSACIPLALSLDTVEAKLYSFIRLTFTPIHFKLSIIDRNIYNLV